MRTGSAFEVPWRAAVRALRTPAIIAAGYLLLRALFVWLAAGHGLISQDASVDLPLLALGAAVLGLRLLVLFVLLPLAIYRLITVLAARGKKDTPVPRTPRAQSSK